MFYTIIILFPLPKVEPERMLSQLQNEITYTNDTTLDMTVKTLRISKKLQLQNREKQLFHKIINVLRIVLHELQFFKRTEFYMLYYIIHYR